MRFKNGITGNLRMHAFTANGGRVMKFYGTHGEIELNETLGKIKVMPFRKEYETIEINSLVSAVDGHGGGDTGLIKNLYEALTSKKADKNMTSLAASIESHLMGFAAEDSRVHNGQLVSIKH